MCADVVFSMFSPSPLWQSVEERCEYRINSENTSWTEIKREAWITSRVYGLSRAIQVSGLRRLSSPRIGCTGSELEARDAVQF